MSDHTSPAVDVERAMPLRLNVPTWRYQGEREAADLAYCVRFGVDKAPEPTIAPGGALAYALPAVDPRR
jgi:hypothetical protein